MLGDHMKGRKIIGAVIVGLIVAAILWAWPYAYYYVRAVLHPPATMVVINEVRTAGDGDWVELYNRSAEPARLGGFGFRDGDSPEAYPIPAETVIPPLGFFVLEEFGFGLGGGDSATLYGWGGKKVVNTYSWSEHPERPKTRGRCPDGTGEFVVADPTRGVANVC